MDPVQEEARACSNPKRVVIINVGNNYINAEKNGLLFMMNTEFLIEVTSYLSQLSLKHKQLQCLGEGE